MHIIDRIKNITPQSTTAEFRAILLEVSYINVLDPKNRAIFEALKEKGIKINQ